MIAEADLLIVRGYQRKEIVMRTTFRYLLATVAALAISGMANAYTYNIVLKASDLLKKGREMIQVGNTEQAREIFTAALDRDLTDWQRARAHNGMCVALIMEEAWTDALDHCNTAIRIVPNNWRFYNNRGNIYLETGEIDMALEEYRRGLAMAPESYVIKRNIELADLRSKDSSAEHPQTMRPT
jgi:tetratricopeptide (TPR) repeat protein